MVTKNSLVFIIDDSELYGKAVHSYLRSEGFWNVIRFQDEKHCLRSMDKRPEVLILDYQLNYMNGLELLMEARKKSSEFFSILLSGSFDRLHYNTGKPLPFFNQYIRKDEYGFKKLTETLANFMDPAYNLQFY
jgi:CheY-like chemotaxis protein